MYDYKEFYEENDEEISIVPMEEKHLDEIVKLEQLCFSEPWSRKGFKVELDNPNALFLVAVKNEKVIGYIGSHCVCRECYITNIAVSQEHRRQKVATRMLEHFMRIITEKTGFISLEVRESNKAALSLYLNFGFQLVGQRKNFYRKPEENALVLTLFT